MPRVTKAELQLELERAKDRSRKAGEMLTYLGVNNLDYANIWGVTTLPWATSESKMTQEDVAALRKIARS